MVIYGFQGLAAVGLRWIDDGVDEVAVAPSTFVSPFFLTSTFESQWTIMIT